MADTSGYSIEERLVASVWVHERQHTGQTMSQVRAAFLERFNKAPPPRATLLEWEKYNAIGPYIFDGPVNAASYSAVLEMWLVPQLRDGGLLDKVQSDNLMSYPPILSHEVDYVPGPA
jgi:hypothetical protein